jgi:hypothetical protein
VTLKDFTEAVLRRELERRAQMPAIPEPLAAPDFTPVVNLVLDDVAQIVHGERDEDMRQYIYEEAIKAVYGPDIWPILNRYL